MSQREAPTLHWDEARQDYFYYDTSTGHYVYRTGLRLPRGSGFNRPASSPLSGHNDVPTYPQLRSSYASGAYTTQLSEPLEARQERRMNPQQRPLSSDELYNELYRPSGSKTFAPSDPQTLQRHRQQQNLQEEDNHGISSGSRDSIVAGPSTRPRMASLAAPEESERLHSSYRRRPSQFFRVGRVFLVLWTEPAGETTTTVSSASSDPAILPGLYGEHNYSKVRRFVVIREGHQYCSALPITTYNHRGVSKRGVEKSDHIIIHTGPTAPAPLKSEEPGWREKETRFAPIQVVPDDPRNVLDPSSRLDLGKIYTVQHNIKVKPFGMVHQRSRTHLLTQFSRVFLGTVEGSNEEVEKDEEGEGPEGGESDEATDEDGEARAQGAQALGERQAAARTDEVFTQLVRGGRTHREAMRIMVNALTQQQTHLTAKMAESTITARRRFMARRRGQDRESDSDVDTDHSDEDDSGEYQEDDGEEDGAEEDDGEGDRQDKEAAEDEEAETDEDTRNPAAQALAKRHEMLSQLDSGSGTHREATRSTVDAFGLQQPPQTDSGYASTSMGTTDLKNDVEQVQDLDDIGTVLEPNEKRQDLPARARDRVNKRIIQLIEEHLLRRSSKPLVTSRARSRFETHLQALSKDFLAECGNSSADVQQSAQFISQQRKRLAALLVEDLNSEFEAPQPVESLLQPLEIADWNSGVSRSNEPDVIPQDLFEGVADLGDEISEDADDLPELKGFDFDRTKAALRGSDAFARLIMLLQTFLDYDEAPGMRAISDHLRDALHMEHGTPGDPLIRVRFRIAWDPMEFLRQDFDAGNKHRTIEALAVTACAETQHCVTTFRDYLQTVWPLTGADTATALDRFLVVPDGLCENKVSVVELEDRLKMHASIVGGNLLIDAWTSASRMEELAQQLAWLGAAFRSCHGSKSPEQPVYLRPELISARDDRPERSAACFDINFVEESLPRSKVDFGRCWTPLFSGLCIAYGFPVPRRDSQFPGLEVQFDTLCALGVVEKATEFDGKVILKGHQAMLVAVMSFDDCVLWHLAHTDDDLGIGYEAAYAVKTTNNLTLDCLDCSRHFVGWADEIRYILGTKGARYKIEVPYVSETTSRIEISQAQLNISKIVGGSITFVRSKREKLIVEPGSFNMKIKWLHQTPIIMYDDESQQAWLQPADRVLVHSLRSRIYEHYEDFKDEDFKYAGSAAQADVGAVLLDTAFGDTRLDEEVTIKSMILDLYEVFRKMHGYLHQPGTSSNLKLPTRGSLEAWSYRGIVNGLDVVPDRKIDLNDNRNGKAWANLCRALQAMVLVGGGFGDLLLPVQQQLDSSTRTVCRRFQQMPDHLDLLAAPVQILQQISQRNRYHSSTTLQLAPGLHWHQSHLLFDTCSCSGKISGRPCNYIQELYTGPRVGPIRSPSADIFCRYSAGAVIFGMEPKWKKILSGAKTLRRQKTPSDSGLGSSMSSSNQTDG